MFDAGFHANWLHLRSSSRHSALDVRHISERGTEHFFLFRAMRAPPRAIHLHVVLRETTGKVVVAMRLPLVPNVVHSPERQHNHRADNHLAQKRGIALHGFLYHRLLSFSSLLRHKSFLYHDAQGRRQNVEHFEVQSQSLPIYHHINRAIEFKIDPIGGASLG